MSRYLNVLRSDDDLQQLSAGAVQLLCGSECTDHGKGLDSLDTGTKRKRKRERERERERQRQTETDRDRQREREGEKERQTLVTERYN